MARILYLHTVFRAEEVCQRLPMKCWLCLGTESYWPHGNEEIHTVSTTVQQSLIDDLWDYTRNNSAGREHLINRPEGCIRSAATVAKTVTKRKGPHPKKAAGLVLSGAGEGNRTLVMSLGSSGNAIIRRPLGRLLRPGRLFTRCAAAGEARGGVFVDFSGFFRQGSGAPRGGGG